MSNPLSSIILAIITTMSASASTLADTPADSVAPSDITLDEVTIQAPRVIHKADMDVLFPSESAVAHSQNGLNLISHLMIPTVSVNELMGTVRTSGQDVEIRINGRKATPEQLLTIQPSTVKRVEWIDNPGLRYGEAPGVLNLIVSNPTVGGSIMVNGTQAFTQAWGNGYLDLKLNNGRSQWAIGTRGRYTNHVSTYREYSETFTGHDGISVTRTETPVKGYVSLSNLHPTLSYNYINPDNTVIWVSLNLNRDWPTEKNNLGLMTVTGEDKSTLLHEMEKNRGTKPSLNAYIEQNLSRSQTIAIDLTISMLNGISSHDYEERYPGAAPFTDVHTSIHDRNMSLNMEADYIKRWNKSSLTSGINHASARNRSVRENGTVSHQRQDKTYLFAEYMQRIGHFSLTGGIGAQYAHLLNVEREKGTSTWSLRPRFSASYRLDDHSRVRFNLTSWQTSPSISQTNVTPQQIDGFQYQTGNPSLKTYSNYKVSLQYNFSFQRFNGKLEGRWTTAPRCIAPVMRWHGDKLVTSFENSRGQSSWLIRLAPQIDIIPQTLTLNGSVAYYHGSSHGSGYDHTHSSWSGYMNLTAYYRRFSLMVSIEQNNSTLWGETITTGEKTSMIALTYKWQGLMVAGGVFMPFTRYSMSSESLNRYNSNRNILRSKGFDGMPCIQIAYNFNWGKQKKTAGKLIDAGNDTQQSQAVGR